MKLNLTDSEVEALLLARRAQAEELTQELNHTLNLLLIERDEVDFLMSQVRDLSDRVSKQTHTDIQAENRVRANQREVVENLLKAIFGNNKIQAIKAARNLTGIGLKEAKDLVEKYWEAFHSLKIEKVPYEGAMAPQVAEDWGAERPMKHRD